MIHVKNLSKSYSGVPVLHDLSFSVESGTIMGFLGPNGAGKTTLMRILAGVLPVSSGQVMVKDIPVHHSPDPVKAHIGYLPESVALYSDMTVRDYLLYMARLRSVEEIGIKEAVDKAMKATELQRVKDRQICYLSRGFQQRVGLAQAIVHNPPILILDEVTSGLDLKQIRKMRTLIQNLSQNRTILLSTHLLSEVQALCDHVLIIDEGKLIIEDRIELLMVKNVQKLSLILKTPKKTVLDKIRDLPSVSHVEGQHHDQLWSLNITASSDDHDCREDLYQLSVKQGWVILEMKTILDSLEEIFLKLTKDERSH